MKLRAKPGKKSENEAPLRMFLVPCSCGATFAVAENYDRQGTAWSRYLPCPHCGKRALRRLVSTFATVSSGETEGADDFGGGDEDFGGGDDYGGGDDDF